MAFGKAGICFLAGIFLTAPALWGADTQFTVRHEHLRKGCAGVMRVSDEGISFSGAHGHAWKWKYPDIHELKMAPDRITVLTYQDSRFRLGAGRVYQFTGAIPKEVCQVWSKKLDQRFVAELADHPSGGWSAPAKHLKPITGSEGVLTFASDHIVYATDAKADSRTWRYSDIDNISSSGPFQLTITTYERAKSHYGDRKEFNFQLKQALNEARYNQLWLDIQIKNGRIQR